MVKKKRESGASSDARSLSPPACLETVLLVLLERVDASTCYRLSSVSVGCHAAIVNNDDLWRRKCVRDWHIPAWIPLSSDWMAHYRQRVREAQEWRVKPRTLYVAPSSSTTTQGLQPMVMISQVLEAAGLSASQLKVDPLSRENSGVLLFDTIKNALLDANDGDTVCLLPGTFEGSFVVTASVEIVGWHPIQTNPELRSPHLDSVIEIKGRPARFDARTCRLSGVSLRCSRLSTGGNSVALSVTSGGVYIEDCDIVGSVSVRGDAAFPTIRRCFIHDSTGSGVSFSDNSRGTVTRCLVGNNAQCGVDVSSGAAPHIAQNDFRDNLVAAIRVSDSGRGAMVENNITSKLPGSFGVCIESDGDPTLIGNYVTHCAGAGVRVGAGGRGTLDGNCFKENLKVAVEVCDGGAPAFRGNRIMNGAGDGIWIHHGGCGTFEDDVIFGNQGVGAVVEGVGGADIPSDASPDPDAVHDLENVPSFRGVTFRDGCGAGMVCGLGAVALIESCTFANNRATGLICRDKHTSPYIRDCKFSLHRLPPDALSASSTRGNELSGAASYVCDSASPTFQGCVFSCNQGPSLVVARDARPRIGRSEFRDGNVGILLTDGALGKITDCLFCENATAGVECVGDARPLLVNCAFTGHGGGAAGALVRHGEGGGGARFLSCTFSGNVGPGLLVEANGYPEVSECVFRGETTEGEAVSFCGALFRLCGGGFLTRCEFSGSGDGVVMETDSWPVVTTCSFANCGGAAIRSRQRGGGEITECQFSDNKEACVTVESGGCPLLSNNRLSGDVIVRSRDGGLGQFNDNTFCDGNIGVLLTRGGGSSFKGNNWSNLEDAAVRVMDGGKGCFVGDTFTCANTAVHSQDKDSCPELRQCIIRGDCKRGGAVFIKDGGGVMEGCDVQQLIGPGVVVESGGDPFVSSTILRKNASCGVVVRAHGRGTFDGCILIENGDCAVLIEQDGDPVLSSCDIHSGLRGGVRCATLSLGRVSACDIHDNQGCGVEVSAGANPVFSNNKIRRSDVAGVYVHSRGLGSFHDDLFCDNFGPALLVETEGLPTLRYCKVTAGEGVGLLFRNGGQGTVEDCEISNNTDSGIQIEGPGTAPTLRRNTIKDGDTAGMWVCSGGAGLIEENSVCNNAFAGLVVETGGSPSVRKNYIYGGRRAGISVEDGGLGDFSCNEIYGNAGCGVEVVRNSRPTFSQNSISDCCSFGVSVHDGGEGVFSDNRIFGNRMANVHVESDGTPLFEHNQIFDGKREGVLVTCGGVGMFTKNEIFANEMSGIRVDVDGRPSLRGNRVYHNGMGGVWIRADGGGEVSDNSIFCNVGEEIDVAVGSSALIRDNDILSDPEEARAALAAMKSRAMPRIGPHRPVILNWRLATEPPVCDSAKSHHLVSFQ